VSEIRAVDDAAARADLKVPAKAATLRLGRKFSRAAQFRPSGGGDAGRPERVDEGVEELRLDVPDELLVVELTP